MANAVLEEQAEVAGGTAVSVGNHGEVNGVEASDGVDEISISTRPAAQHCSSIHGAPEVPCAGAHVPNLKQRRNVRLLAALTRQPEPDVDHLTFSEADQWLAKAWRRWMEMGGPIA